jgi:hypothetical protein
MKALGALVVLAVAAWAAGPASAAPAASVRQAVNLYMDVTFFDDGSITLTLPDGTPVGSTAGPPTVVPAGYYTLLLSGPGGCNELPYFELQGPGENVLDNMELGLVKSSDIVNLLPNSTYTWRDYALPGVTHTFATSADVVGTQPPPAPNPAGAAAKASGSTSSQDIVGSGMMPLLGRLHALVGKTGTLTVTYLGKRVTHLKPGRYRITVTGRRLVLWRKGGSASPVTGTVALRAGRWFFRVAPSGAAYVVTVTS